MILILEYFVAVIVSPHGIRGSLTGCLPSDLVKQGYLRSFPSISCVCLMPYLLELKFDF